MTESLTKTVEAWQLWLTFGLTLLGGVATAGAAWSNISYRMNQVEDRAKMIEVRYEGIREDLSEIKSQLRELSVGLTNITQRLDREGITRK